MSKHVFKEGDVVRRINSSLNDCKLGELYTVSGYIELSPSEGCISLRNIEGSYFAKNFKLVKKANKYSNPPHKHAELIKAWADGAEIQFHSKSSGMYVDIHNNRPYWDEKEKYRIKPDSNKDHIRDKIENLLSEVKELKKQLEEL